MRNGHAEHQKKPSPVHFLGSQHAAVERQAASRGTFRAGQAGSQDDRGLSSLAAEHRRHERRRAAPHRHRHH